MNQTNSNAKLYGILAYIGILWLVGMFVQPEKDDPFVRFHVNQGIVLFIAAVLVNFLATIWGIFGILDIGVFVLFILGIVNVCRGECKPLPLIGGFVLYK